MASGSALTDGMVVCPCSGGTLSAIATAASGNLIQRAADVHLKERRKLILVPRETPLSIIQLENMRRVSEAGAVVLPAMPGFYHGAASIAELIDFVVARICDQLGVEHDLMRRWGQKAESGKPKTENLRPELSAEAWKKRRWLMTEHQRKRSACELSTSPLFGRSSAVKPLSADDPLQPYAVCAAVCIAGGGHGLEGGATTRVAVARSAGRAVVHGLGAERGDGLQSGSRIATSMTGRSPRTRSRHIPAGLLSVRSVALFAVGCAAAFVASTALFLPNRLPLILSLPVLAFICGYSYAKRFTMLAHFWLGAALMLAPVAAWIAVRGEVAWPPVVLGGAVLLWVAGFDIIYACQDVEVDAALGLRSVPATVGVPRALRLAALCHLGMVLLLFWLPRVYPPLGAIYLAGIVAVAVLLIYEHWLVRPDDLSRVNTAFFHVNAVVSLGLLTVGALDLLT